MHKINGSPLFLKFLRFSRFFWLLIGKYIKYIKLLEKKTVSKRLFEYEYNLRVICWKIWISELLLVMLFGRMNVENFNNHFIFLYFLYTDFV